MIPASSGAGSLFFWCKHMKKMVYGTYGTLFGIGHAKQKLDANPEAKHAVKSMVNAGKRALKAVPQKFVQMSKRAEEWSR